MVFCGSFALLIGYLAGLRFRVAAVLLIEMMAVPTAVALVALGQVAAHDAAWGFVLGSVALQVGYGLALVRPRPVRMSGQRHPAKA